MSEWTPGVVMCRFLEACDTEHRTPNTGMPMVKSCWPIFRDHEEGRSVSDQLDDLDRRRANAPASPDAISRYAETLDWSLHVIKDGKLRLIVWTWAFCAVTPKRSFSKACDHHGWARQATYRRLTGAFERIAAHLRNNNIVLRHPADKWMRHDPQDDVHVGSTIKNSASAAEYRAPRAFISEKSTDMLTSAEAIETFVEHLEKVNAIRRKARIQRVDRAAEARADA